MYQTQKAAFLRQTHSQVVVSDRQKSALNIYLDGYSGKLTVKNWAKLVKVSDDTAARDVKDLVGKGILVPQPGRVRDVSYGISISADRTLVPGLAVTEVWRLLSIEYFWNKSIGNWNPGCFFALHNQNRLAKFASVLGRMDSFKKDILGANPDFRSLACSFPSENSLGGGYLKSSKSNRYIRRQGFGVSISGFAFTPKAKPVVVLQYSINSYYYAKNN